MKTLAIDIGGTAIKYGLVDNNFKIIEFNEIESEAKLGGKHIIDKIIETANNYRGTFDSIGISTAGQVDSKNGVILYANENIPNYTGARLSEIILENFNVPVSVENDVNCAAIAEAKLGAGFGYNDFLCLTYGTGIGGALWINGDLFTGSNFSAGEVGNIITHAGGRRCPCGNNGCYEMYASTSALISDIREKTGLTLTGREIFSEENFQNKIIKEVIDNWIEEIVIGLTGLIFTFNPSLIVLGGGIMKQNYIVESVAGKIHSKEMHSFKSVEIKSAMLGNKAGMLGAAYLVKHKN